MAPHRHQHRQLCVRGLIDGQVFLGAILTSVWPARFYYQGAVGNEVGASDPAFMGKHAQELEKDSGKWIDHSVWHGKAHTWDKVKWAINEVRRAILMRGPPSCGRTEPWMASGRRSRAGGRSCSRASRARQTRSSRSTPGARVSSSRTMPGARSTAPSAASRCSPRSSPPSETVRSFLPLPFPLLSLLSLHPVSR